MSAEIYENDYMFSGNGITPWHNLGIVVAGAPTSEEAIKLAKLDWDVIQYPVYANNSRVENYYANMRSDTNTALGVVKGRYKVVQNVEAFNFVDDIVGNGETEVHYETAGSLFNGRRVFLLCNLPDQTLVGDKVKNYLFFTNSHDGSSSLTAGITNVRVVCNNTLQLAIRQAPRLWKCRHTESIKEKQEQAQRSLGLATKYLGEIKEVADGMATKLVNERAFFEHLFKASNLSEKASAEVFESVHDLYQNKPDLANFKGTAWGLYNAVADYVSNGEPMRKTKTYEERKLADWFDGYKLLNTAQSILISA
jgi:phage/plasmid-like protein (TIGR03299 family)